MSTPLISLPPKTTSPVDFGPSLAPLLRSLYSVQASTYSSEIAAVNRARQDALGSAGSDETGRDLLLRWFGMLELLELRFSDVRVAFPWHDAFTQLPTTQSSLAYEKASVLFLLASTYSSLAAHSPRSSPESLKRAFVATRSTMGILSYISENFLHAPSVDLGREVVGILGRLMEAQGTEIFFEIMASAPVVGDPKAAGTEIKAGKSSALKGKICMQASTLYASVIEEVKEWVTKGTFIKEWSLLIQTKAKYFSSLAQYHSSLSALSLGQHGLSLARLGLSLTLAKEAQKLASQFSSAFVPLVTATSLPTDAPTVLSDTITTHTALIEELRAKGERDNDLIYHDSLPSLASLPAIDKSSVINSLPIHEIYATPATQKLVGSDLFEKLIPLGVVELGSVYTEEMAKLVRLEADRCQGAEGEAESGLGFIGLPNGLERFKDIDAGMDALMDPGKQVREWAEEIRSQENSREGPISQILVRLDKLKFTTATKLAGMTVGLEKEAFECEQLRNQFGSAFEQLPSAQFTQAFRADISSHQSTMSQAATSDEQVARIYKRIESDIKILSNSNERIAQHFAEIISLDSSAPIQVSLLDLDVSVEEMSLQEKEETRTLVEKVQEGLSRLRKIRKERSDVLKDLKEKVHNDDISHLLLLNRKGNNSSSNGLDPIFVTELEKFRPYQQRITSTVNFQASVISSIATDFKALTSLPSARALQARCAKFEKRRNELVSRLGQSFGGYDEVRQGSSKGIDFYAGLESIVTRLESDVQDFINTRGREKDDLKRRAESRVAMNSSNRAPSVPTRSNSAYSVGGLENRMNGMDLRTALPPPSPYSPPPGQYSSPPISTYAPSPPPPNQHYQSMPNTGAFSMNSQAPSSYQNFPPPPPQPARSEYTPRAALPPPGAPLSYSNSYSAQTPQNQTQNYAARPPIPAHPRQQYSNPQQYAPSNPQNYGYASQQPSPSSQYPPQPPPGNYYQPR